MITCRDLTRFLMDYIEGTLPAGQKDVFEHHLSICPACIAYLRTYQETVKLGKEAFLLPDEPVPPSVPEPLVKAILQARARSRS
jgi:anti-sigma factor RsiW